ncbi:MAG: rRNA maturation RNase YbeY [Pirellulales bacterium]
MTRPRFRAGRSAARGRPDDGIVVEVVDRQKLLRLSPAWLRRAVSRGMAAIGVERAEITVLLVDDRGIAALHDRWLGIPGPTDVITFDLADDTAAGLEGDIAVSTETARRMARELGWQPRHELAYYVMHGLLHLAGDDDQHPAARRRMRARERLVMEAAGLPRPPRRRRAAASRGGSR